MGSISMLVAPSPCGNPCRRRHLVMKQNNCCLYSQASLGLRGRGGSPHHHHHHQQQQQHTSSKCRALHTHDFPDWSERSSPLQVRKEIERCYQLIHRLGRGAVYLGSSRVNTGHPHYLQALELAREIAKLLDCTTWTGVGPGLMDAAVKGALEAKKPVGGFKIAKEAGEWTTSNFHPYLPPETYLTCRFFSARKHGLVDAAVRNKPSDMTAVVAFPGGIGTLDEIFEILALIQLERIGSNLPVPFLLLNYNSFYSKLLDFFDDCEKWGTVARGEVASLWKVCDGNLEALEYLADFYSLPQSKRDFNIGDSVKPGMAS
ncbi:LOG family protein [Dioscorea alata]|uniref:LOG family protein n=1 Tax=Dioscorea alata TaxID=55571 RepID=A0ACB7VH03_DIOAL|nr:LOG family protein [Dioscorea alata]